MGASDAVWILSALGDVVDGLDRYRAAPRLIHRPNIGTLHFLPMPAGMNSLWGMVKRYQDEPEPFHAIFEVEADNEPCITQEAHYTAVRRLEAHYLGSAAAVLLGMMTKLPEEITSPPGPVEIEDFRTVSLRIPPAPFGGDAWQLRYRHRGLPRCIFEIEYRFANIVDVSIAVEPAFCPVVPGSKP
jgi:hypothetical protein